MRWSAMAGGEWASLWCSVLTLVVEVGRGKMPQSQAAWQALGVAARTASSRAAAGWSCGVDAGKALASFTAAALGR
jgi:hypothetical protein